MLLSFRVPERFFEINDENCRFCSSKLFVATIRLHEATKTITVRIEIDAESATDAKLRLTAIGKAASCRLTSQNLI